MKKDDISSLLQRYLSARASEKEPYFDADEIDELLNSFEESDDYTYYEEVLNLGLRLHPGNRELQIKQCRQLIFNEHYNEALELLDSLGETDNPDAEMLRIECYCSLEQYFEKTVPYIEARIAEKFEYVENIFEYLATLLNDLDDLPAADHLINWGLKLYPNNQILQDEYCFTLESEGKIPEAIEICNKLIDKNPFSYDYWFMLGRLYSLSGEYEKAIDAFDFALTCDDSSGELKLLRAYCLYMNGNYRKALESYMELASEEVMWKQIRSVVAECHLYLEEYEEAYTILHPILLEKDPEAMQDHSFFSSYVKCCLQTGRRQEAFDMLELALKRFPDNMDMLADLGYDLLMGDDYELTNLVMDRYNLYSNQLWTKAKQDKEWLGDLSVEELKMFLQNKQLEKSIPPEELTREFLKNKENKN